MKTKPSTGTKVKMSGKFLRNTGQYGGREGLSRWLVIECSCGFCAGGRHVAVDEPIDASAYRHIAFAHLETAK